MEIGSRQIRLLRLGRRLFFALPSCELLQFSLDKAPAFEAISYTWGSKKRSIRLDVSGQYILVPSAVNDLLWYRRSGFGARYFWIDAVCIKQIDVKEKGAQIPLMLDIYRCASQVTVWLNASTSLKQTRMLRRVLEGFAWQNTGVIYSRLDLIQGLFDREDQGRAFRMLGELLRQPWFERIWVVQEVVAGRKVHVMSYGIVMNWDDLMTIVNSFCDDLALERLVQYHLSQKAKSSVSPSAKVTHATDAHRISLSQANLINQARVDFNNGGGSPLGSLIASTERFQSSDTRDRLYALLGISCDGHYLPFTPGYSDPVDEVYMKTAAFLLSRAGWFRTLGSAEKGYYYE